MLSFSAATLSASNTVSKISEDRQTSMRTAIGIATRGRPEVLCQTLQRLRQQQRQADAVIVCYAAPEDVGDAPLLFPEMTFLRSEPGLTRQRNAILQEAHHVADILLFLDDDFCMRTDFLEYIAAVFRANPDVVVATGNVLADGINGPGLSFEEADQAIGEPQLPVTDTQLVAVFNAYGCNMALRLKTIDDHQLRFNEDLPLYGWYEDVEFSRQMAAYGRVVKVPQACGVHLGVKGGRQSGMRLGYSQIANPLYLAQRKSVPWSYAVASMVSRSGKNLVRSIRPEPFVDRRGRLRGNLRGWIELLRGVSHPLRAAKL